METADITARKQATPLKNGDFAYRQSGHPNLAPLRCQSLPLQGGNPCCPAQIPWPPNGRPTRSSLWEEPEYIKTFNGGLTTRCCLFLRRAARLEVCLGRPWLPASSLTPRSVFMCSVYSSKPRRFPAAARPPLRPSACSPLPAPRRPSTRHRPGCGHRSRVLARAGQPPPAGSAGSTCRWMPSVESAVLAVAFWNWPPFSLSVFLFPSLLNFLSLSSRDTYPSLSLNSSQI